VSRLSRFEEYRYIGVRETMRVYDCDDEGQLGVLQGLVEEGDLLDRNLIQTFSPDTPTEARNRGFKLVGDR
jgi:hypothetical protein